MLKLTALKKKNTFFLISLLACLTGAFVYYFACIKLKPNDLIIATSDGTALFSNENPTFKIDFGSKENPQGQVIRFEAQATSRNPFELKGKESIFTKIAEIFSPKKKYGIEMSLIDVDFGETGNNSEEQLEDSVISVAEILDTDKIETSTNLIDMGRKIGEYDTEQAVSKQTIVNEGVAEGIDLEYQILAGLGLKEEIVINSLEKYMDNCGKNCSLPSNKFEFDLSVDEGVVLKKGWFTVAGQSTEIYYFVDGDGKYLAHFLPSYAIDDVGNKTYDVDLDMQEYSAGKFKATVAVDPNWLLNANRVYPIRIDPSIVHDETSDFSGGVFNKTTSVTGPKILIDTSTSSYWGEYISSIIDLGSSMSTGVLSWLSSGVNTGDGETPYSTTGLVAQWNFNETSGTTAVSGGSCGTSCNGTLTNFASTGSQDAAIGTGWTANNRRWGSGASTATRS